MIELRDVVIQKGKTVILNQVNWQIAAGHFYLLRAGNGLGKSSLLNVISGIESVHQGQVNFFKQNQRITRRQAIAQLVCYLPHDYPLDSQLTGQDYLRLYQQLWTSQVDITALCQRLKIDQYVDRKIGQYSLGMYQMLLLALYEVTAAPIWLLDELANGLDGTNLQLLVEELAHAKQAGRTIILVTHQQNELNKLADATYTITQQRLCEVTEHD